MPQHNLLSVKVKLKEDVTEGQLVTLKGHLATGATDRQAQGVAMYDGKAGEDIAVSVVGIAEVQHDGTLVEGQGITANAGIATNLSKAITAGVVSTIISARRAEVILGCGMLAITPSAGV